MIPSETNKLYKSIATDFKIITRKTGLWKMEYCDEILHDIKIMMLNDFIEKVSLILDKPIHTPIKVKQFLIGTTTRTQNDRPGDNDWEEAEGDRLHVVLSYTPSWKAKTPDEQIAFHRSNLKVNWQPVSYDTAFPQLTHVVSKMYSTGTNGVNRTDFK
jgi:hypothetical protein